MDKYKLTLDGLTLEEAREACGALALARINARRECDYDVGYVCPQCFRMFAPGVDDDLYPRLVKELEAWFFDRHVKKEGER